MAPPPLWLPHADQASKPAALKPRLFAERRELPLEPDWVWQGFLAPGSLTMLAGHPFAGKSRLVSGLLRALETGEPFLGRKTKGSERTARHRGGSSLPA